MRRIVVRLQGATTGAELFYVTVVTQKTDAKTSRLVCHLTEIALSRDASAGNPCLQRGAMLGNEMNWELFAGGLLAFVLAALLLWVLEPVAHRIGLIDHPGDRKIHHHPTPLVGGIAMFVAFAFSILMLDISLSDYRMLFAGSLLLVVVGVIDDLHELSASHRFIAQIAAGLLMTLGGRGAGRFRLPSAAG